MATVVTLSVLLSYVAVFVTDSYAYSGTSSLVQFGTVSADMRNESGKVVRGNATMYVTSSWLSNYDLVKDLCLVVDSYVDSSTGLTRYNVSVNMNGVKDNDKETHSYLQTQYESLADCNDFGSVLGAYSYMSSVYVFKDRASARSYLAGNMSESELKSLALNYDKIQESQREYDYDETYPYYDKASIAVNANSTATYNANMSQDMTNRYYELNAKIADKTGNSDDKHTRAYVEYYAAAIYADSSQLGVFNNYVLQYGNSVGSLSGTLPNGKKMDEIVKFDSNGRLCVSGYSGVEERGYKLICKEDTSSYLIAVEIDKVTANDQVLCSPSFQRQLDADLKFTNSGSADGFLFGGTNSDSYTLIGYCTDIRINIVQGNKYTYSKDTYTYTWLNSAMRDRYGTKSTTYDNNSISTGENYEFDNNGNGYGGFEISDQTNMDSMKDYARTGFGLLGKDGYLALTAAALYQVPFFIWQCIGFVICVYGTFVLMKLLVKFL